MSAKKLRVLLADDRPDGLVLMRELVEAVLLFLKISKGDVDLTATSDRAEAETLGASGERDLVIVDLMWPVAGAERKAGLAISEFAKNANPRTVVVVITGKPEQEQSFRAEARSSKADFGLTWEEAFGAGKVPSARAIADALRPNGAASIPDVSESVRTTIGLLGLDTVAYSEEDDETQARIVTSFLRYVREAWQELDREDCSPVFLFTGDGLILGIVGDEGPRLALDLAATVCRQMTKLAGYHARLAVHFGPANVVTLDNGATQLLGHAVNWLCRAMNEAPPQGLVVTDEYFQSMLQSGRAVIPGLTFTRREAGAKHNRPLVIYDVAF